MADPYDLQRFVEAQEKKSAAAPDGCFTQALAELRSGRKQSHWMWFIFPQFEGLGSSPTARYYSVKSLAEAQAYLAHPVLGPRLVESAETILAVDGRSAHDILGSPDDRKLGSCATLFAQVSPPGSVFHQLLDKYFEREPDQRTLLLLARAATAGPASERPGG